MAARATRSASRKARATEAVATGPLGALSHDELGVIFDGLADPLEPVVAVALSSTCVGLRTPLRAALEVLQERHVRAMALCHKMGTCLEALRDATKLIWAASGVTVDDMATLGMILHTVGLPRLQDLALGFNGFRDAGMQAMCEGLGHGAAPSLVELDLGLAGLGPASAEALAGALRRGAMPKLKILGFSHNPVGSQGMAALAAPLRLLRGLKKLFLHSCHIGDQGVASLVTDLGKDDFRALEVLGVSDNNIADVGAATLAAALDAGGLPKLTEEVTGYLRAGGGISLGGGAPSPNSVSAAGIKAVSVALAKRSNAKDSDEDDEDDD